MICRCFCVLRSAMVCISSHCVVCPKSVRTSEQVNDVAVGIQEWCANSDVFAALLAGKQIPDLCRDEPAQIKSAHAPWSNIVVCLPGFSNFPSCCRLNSRQNCCHTLTGSS